VIVDIPPAYESTGYRRFLAFDGTPYPGRLAIELPAELSIVDEPETSTRPPRSRLMFVGVPGGAVPLTRVMNGTSPLRVNGGASATLAADITLSILPASGSTAGTMSIADFNKLAGIGAGATVVSVSGVAPIVSSGGPTPAISITAATTLAAGSLSAADKTKLDSLTSGAAVASVGATAPITSTGGTTPNIGIQAAALARMIWCGANTKTATTTTRYLTVGFNPGTAFTSPVDMPVVKPFKIDSLAYTTRLAGAAGGIITFALRKNGALAGGGSALAVATDGGVGPTVVTSSFAAVSFASGDTWSIQIDQNVGVGGGGPTDFQLGVGIIPP